MDRFNQRSLLILFICLLYLTDTGDSIKCYFCASHKHGEEKCGENSNLRPTDTEFIMECEISCKLGYIENVVTGMKVYGRTCGKTPVQDCKKKELKRNHTGEFCQCKSDYCNLNWEIDGTGYEPQGLAVWNAAVTSSKSLLFYITLGLVVSGFM